MVQGNVNAWEESCYLGESLVDVQFREVGMNDWQQTGISERNIIGYTVPGIVNDWEQTCIAKRIISICTVQGSGSSWGETCLRESLVGIVYSTN
jgi:hypothetical protein